MVPGILTHFLGFLSAYMCMDAVLPDFDKIEDYPEKLRWAGIEEQMIATEYMESLLESNWKNMSKPRSGFQVQWHHSSSYSRDIQLITKVFPQSIDQILKSFWVESFSQSEIWESLFSSSKLLSYAGNNKVIGHSQTQDTLPGWVIAPRDFVSLAMKIDNIGSDNFQHLAQPLLKYFSQRGWHFSTKNSLIVVTNASKHDNEFPPLPGVIRGTSGPSGWLMTSVSPESDSATRIHWLMNVDSQIPKLVPTVMTRKIMIKSAMDALEHWQNYLTNMFPAS